MMLFGRLFIFIFKTRYIHFFLIGTSGILLNLLVTWFLTEFVFGLERYFIAYIIGTAANLLYNFICNTVITFKTRRNHFVRLLRFVVYNLSMAIVQAAVVKYVTPLVGLEYYLFVIATVVLLFSIVNFVVSKLYLFKEKDVEIQ